MAPAAPLRKLRRESEVISGTMFDMATPDLQPAATSMAGLLAGISDDQLGASTPCPDYVLGDLVDHVGGLAKAFTWAATKDPASAFDGTVRRRLASRRQLARGDRHRSRRPGGGLAPP